MHLSRAVQRGAGGFSIVWIRRSLPLVLLLCLALPVEKGWAGELYRCLRADGERVFKNFPCRKGEQSESIPLPPAGNISAIQLSETAVGPQEIPLVTPSQLGGYWVDVTLNETVQGRFVVDTGASTLLLPEEMFEELQRNGLTAQDQIGTNTMKIADGSLVEVREIHLKRVTLGKRGIEHVVASVGKRGIAPLLGITILERFGKWLIDAEKSKLILGGRDGEAPTDPDGMVNATCLKQKRRIEHNQEQAKQLSDTHNREQEALQEARKKLNEEKRRGIREGLVEQYNAEVVTFQQNTLARKTSYTQLLEESKHQVESYNKRCLSRMYQEAGGNWRKFIPFQLVAERDSRK
ncbi:MAG: retroviral-like aspartic protease family protein [Magnetococcales bacterium]|nr:retroviral-like aspartic protease family protein [Magnetococcales bacterium]